MPNRRRGKKNKHRNQHKRRNSNNHHRHKRPRPKKGDLTPISVPEDDPSDRHRDEEAPVSPDHGHGGKIQRTSSAEVITPSMKSTSHSAGHSPWKLHYEADDDDVSDTQHLSPLHQPAITPDPNESQSISSSNPYHGLSNLDHTENGEHRHSSTSTEIHPVSVGNGSTKMQILRSAKISHRSTRTADSSDDGHGILSSAFNALSHLTRAHSNPVVSKPVTSPGFSLNSPQLLAQHQHHQMPAISPLSTFRRASSDTMMSPTPSLRRSTSSPFGSPGKSILYRSPSRSTSPSGSSAHHIRFGAVEVHEFKLTAGSESDGVPEDGGYSLHLDRDEIRNQTVDLEEYERRRFSKLIERAQHLHWNKSKLNRARDDPEQYLFTAGRCDEFWDSLTPKEREQRLDPEWRKQHRHEIGEERKALDEIRSSRKDVFCDCKPLSKMHTAELKAVAERYGIPLNRHKKLKKGFLINMIRAQVLNHRDVCCWDEQSCSCAAAGIQCHSGVRGMRCGCFQDSAKRKCGNPNGRYVFKDPRFPRKLIEEWREFYGECSEEENGGGEAAKDSKVSFGSAH